MSIRHELLIIAFDLLSEVTVSKICDYRGEVVDGARTASCDKDIVEFEILVHATEKFYALVSGISVE